MLQQAAATVTSSWRWQAHGAVVGDQCQLAGQSALANTHCCSVTRPPPAPLPAAVLKPAALGPRSHLPLHLRSLNHSQVPPALQHSAHSPRKLAGSRRKRRAQRVQRSGRPARGHQQPSRQARPPSSCKGSPSSALRGQWPWQRSSQVSMAPRSVLVELWWHGSLC